MTQETQSAITREVKAMIGVSGDIVESWGYVDTEYLRRFTQAVMDPDPRYWDEEFAKSTQYGGVITPPIMVSYMASRVPPNTPDPITKAFEEDPMSDGIGRVERLGSLPRVPPDLVRVLNAGHDEDTFSPWSLAWTVFVVLATLWMVWSMAREVARRESNRC